DFIDTGSHNLSELREQLLKVVSVGVFDHTIAAFWQYILYAEILLKLRETLLPKARYNFSLLNRIRELEEKYRLTVVNAAAFSDRPMRAGHLFCDQSWSPNYHNEGCSKRDRTALHLSG